ncbi:SatD family protein [Knoellia subterranea]|uniref:RNA polymerase subunit sigma-70 n=1 Tax=Knoellia subterranea KCTC 19937 TaxID=1385521 RepID=A0A0A0JQV3_9MICO|nr:SatD family protein [Knoellia subterranea]KGN38422.1 hypothetical protein N803_06675 [Knoellia subterranea KCTC 19937]
MPASRKAHVVLIGDLVASRASKNRRALHRALEQALSTANAAIDHVEPLEITAGDEFQGVFEHLGEALDAALRVRLELLPLADTRHGVGRGSTTTLDPVRGIKDGPAWWAARDAIVEAERAAGRAALGHVRTAYRVAEGEPDDTGTTAAVNAALLCQDHLLGSLSERSLRLVRGLLDGMTQRELAAAEGITASAVSQRVRADGLAVIVQSAQLLRDLP